MLAVQLPRMGSTPPPSNGSLPFGYTVDPSQDSLLNNPPDPPPGFPLLSDDDTTFLSNFFNGIDSNIATNPEFSGMSFGEGLNFSEDWYTLPPQFIGTATSYSPQPAVPMTSASHGVHSMGYPGMMPGTSAMMPPPPPLPPSTAPLPQRTMEQQPSADVLEAATLLQNGSLSRTNGMKQEPMFIGREMGSTLGPPVGHLRHQQLNDFRQDERRMSESDSANAPVNTFAFWALGHNPTSSSSRSSQDPMDIQWGSDLSFNQNQRFVPSSERETTEALQSEHLRYMGCLETSKSAANTRPSSPLLKVEPASPLKLKTRVPGDRTLETGEDVVGAPQKRRKSRAKEEAEDDNEEPLSATSKKKRKQKSADLSASSPTDKDGTGKRRKSTANAAAKPPRENLTEEQKRENHIKSEQKRRTLIKEGFDNLCFLVPGLQGGGFSKSTMLAMAADWLEDLLKGNEKLGAELHQLTGQ